MFWVIWEWIPRPIRKVFLLIIGVVSLIGLPTGGVIAGHSIVETNVAGRSAWRSEADARAGQWDWPSILFWSGLVTGGLIFLFSLLYFFSKDEKHSAWD